MDLSVLYISRAPRFAQLHVHYDPPGYNPYLLQEEANAPTWPNVGDAVHFTARVRNQGTLASPAWGFRWTVDGKKVGEGSAEILAAGAEQDVSFTWSWQDGRHTIGFEITGKTCPGWEDGHAVNNRREQTTNSLLFTM